MRDPTINISSYGNQKFYLMNESKRVLLPNQTFFLTRHNKDINILSLTNGDIVASNQNTFGPLIIALIQSKFLIHGGISDFLLNGISNLLGCADRLKGHFRISQWTNRFGKSTHPDGVSSRELRIISGIIGDRYKHVRYSGYL